MASLLALFTGRESISVKVVLARIPSGAPAAEAVTETRVFETKPGTSSCLHSGYRCFLAEVEARFNVEGGALNPALSYTDEDGDAITVSTDSEFETALKSGIVRFEAYMISSSVVSSSSGAGLTKPPHGDVAWSSKINFWVNGEAVMLVNPDPTVTLLDWLREKKGVLGIHVGCGEGGCGICTVALVVPVPGTDDVETVPINSCLRRLAAVDGCHILTTEGLGSKRSGFHPLQTAIADGNGSQCGFCTPGWVMNMFSLLGKKEQPTAKEIEDNFDGNLCRCTGYRPILTAFGKFAKGGSCAGKATAANANVMASLSNPQAMRDYTPQPLHFSNEDTGMEYYRPLTLEQYAQIYHAGVGAKKLVQPIKAGTADGVKKYMHPESEPDVETIFIDISLLPELQGVAPSKVDGSITFGATVPIATVIETLEEAGVRGGQGSYAVLAEHMKRIASVQIRSVASWAGNIMLTREYPKFASDMATILSAAGAVLTVLDVATNTTHTTSVPDLMALAGDVLLVSMKLPALPADAVFETYKTSQRHVFAHAIVNLGGCLEMDSSTGKVTAATIIVGGATDTLLDASQTAGTLVGAVLDQGTFEKASASLAKEIAGRPSTDPRHSLAYRQTLAAGFLYKLFLSAKGKSLPANMVSAITPFVRADARPISSGTEAYGTSSTQGGDVGKYIPKMDARIQASGEARYPSDYGTGTALFGQLVFATTVGQKLVTLDSAAASMMPGVHTIVNAGDVPAAGMNSVNAAIPGNEQEKVFYAVGDTIPNVGAPLALVVADTWAQARRAAKQVTQTFAFSAAAAAPPPRARLGGEAVANATTSAHRGIGRPELVAGTPDVGSARGTAAVAAAATVPAGMQTATGSFKTGGQRHFYMETQSACVTPIDGGDKWEVVSSCQDGDTQQRCLALVLGIAAHKVTVVTPRAGGAFGGKLTRQMLASASALVAANKLNKPVRIQFERSDDMQMVVGREPMEFDYTVTYDPTTGKVGTMVMDMTIDPGWYLGDSAGCMEMAVGWSDNCYQYESFKVNTHTALSATPHSTAMRAPGCMQSILAAEVVIEHVAKLCSKSTAEVQAVNFYNPAAGPVTTPFGDKIGTEGYNWTIPTLWSQIQDQANFAARQAAVVAYNAANKYTKRGIALTPAKYVMGTDFYSSGALVNLYADGTVMVASGGSELGQGLNTKVALCVADTLNVPLSSVQVTPRDTSKVPNNTATGGSGTSECSSEAAIVACNTLMDRLKPYLSAGKSFVDAIGQANMDGVSMMAEGWFKQKKDDNANLYATYGTAISEVMIDVLTGEVRVEQVDILMDLGTQLDAAIDIGQLQGGFVISLGYLLTEECRVDGSGTQLNLGSWEYKIPSAYDIPVDFNVGLLKDSPNPVGVKGSKASAEPGMTLVASTYLAVKEAIYAAKVEMGTGGEWFMLNTPLTCENIKAAIGEQTMVVPSE